MQMKGRSGLVGNRHGYRGKRGRGQEEGPPTGQEGNKPPEQKGAERERPVQGAQNGPWMDEDPVGPRCWVAGAPMGYKHGMRDAKRGRHQEERVARAAQQPGENEKTGTAGSGP